MEFKCNDCGSDELIVECYYDVLESCEDYLPCWCGEQDVAATLRYVNIHSYREQGVLGEWHRWEWEEGEEIDSVAREEEELEVICADCYEEAEKSNWEMGEVGREDDESSYEFYVRCAGCDREIEFGWSHPDRGGRIWPVETDDFNPWLSWPEPRYRDAWRDKGWLRPNQ